MQASIFEISIFPLVFQIPVSRRIHIRGVRACIRAEYRKRFVGGERKGEGERGGTYELRVTGAPLDSILFRDSTHSFHSAHPLGDFYSSLRISTLTSRHPQPSPSPFVPPSCWTIRLSFNQPSIRRK